MKQDIRKTARRLAELLNMRGVGHTSLMQEGLSHFRADSMVVAHDQRAANRLATLRKETVGDKARTYEIGIDQICDRTHGIRAAVCVDHKVIADLLNGLVNLCEELEGK